MRLLLNCDGGSRGNPGPAAYGFVVYDITGLPARAEGSRNGQTGSLREATSATEGAAIILEKSGNYLGIATNNHAEYQGLVAGISWVVTNYPKATLEIKMDSLLIVNQIKGQYRVKHPDLIPLHREAMSLLAQLPSFSISHTYRENNSLSDQLVNDVLDSHV